MSSAKNVGRKRLGRLPIVGGTTNTSLDRKRPCQIESRAASGSEKVPRLVSPNVANVDLSFSASFACDLESDLDLMTALDKIEKTYKPSGRQAYTKASEKNTTRNSSLCMQKGNKSNLSSLQQSHTKQKDAQVYQTPIQSSSSHRSSNQFSAQKENDSVMGKIRSQRKKSLTKTPAGMQDDGLWASPLGMSTPQDPPPGKSRRSSHNTSRRSASKSTSQNDKKETAKSIGKSGQQRDAKILKTPVQAVENSRVTRSSSKRRSARDAGQKSVLAGLDGNLETPVRGTRGNAGGKINRSDFFKSLFIDNNSFEDISALDLHSEKQTVVVNENKKENRRSNAQPQKLAEKSAEMETAKEASAEMGTASCQNVCMGKTKETAHAKSKDRSNFESRSQGLKQQETGLANTEQVTGDNSVDVAVTDIDADIADDCAPGVNPSEDGGIINIQPAATEDQLSLSSWGLPEPVLKQYHRRGITHMFAWQAECLLQGNVIGGGNLVYSAPTSAGKTMIAELLVLKRVLETRKKAIFILPFVSVSREKMFYLQELYQDAGIRVSGFMGSHAPAGGFSSVDVAVCTIEKGNGIINRCLEENKLDQIGILVVDELHLIGDPHRGYLLELLLTKIAYMVKKSRQTAKQGVAPISIQVVGMSATLPNLDLLAGWLDADLYRTDYRPVPLTECVKIGTALYDNNMALIRDIDTTYQVKGDMDHVVPLCIETIRGGHSILIFCPTKNWCEKLSETVARELYNLLRNPAVAVASTTGLAVASDLLVIPLVQSALRDVVEQLKRTPVGVDQTLGRTVPFGVAYHHAGLTFDERDIVEGAFRQGILKVLIATSTLSSGVNLPARRVLVRTPVFHGQLIDFLTYKQMIGRAGRKGVDTAGESILLCKPSERAKAAKLLGGALPPVKSTLIKNQGEELSSSMKRAILEVVVSGVAMAPGDVAAYAACTLLVASLPREDGQTERLIQQCIKFLQENEFVTSQSVTDSTGDQSERFVPTQLGAAVLASSLSPDEGLLVFSELQRARKCFVLENELHIIYQVTPIYAQGIGDVIDWYQYFCIWEALSPGMKKVAELAGVKESFLARAVQGRVPTKTTAQLQMLRIHKRFYTALALHDLVQETTLPDVAKKYNCNKGQLQSLQQSAATFAGMVTVFCARLGWSNLELILSQFQHRLTFGVQRELCDLVRVSSLNGQRARVMFNAGYQTVAALAGAHPADIEALLKNSAPFQSMKRQDKESDWEVQERCKARCIFLTGRRGVTEYEAASIIISEAKALIQDELGGLGIQWASGETAPGAAARAGAPQLRTPVLTSPLAGRPGRSKSVLGKRRSRSTGKVSTSPSDGGGKRPNISVISPPVPKQQPKQSETVKQHPKQSESVKQQPKQSETVTQQQRQSVNQQPKQSETVNQQSKQSETVNQHKKQLETVYQQPKQSETVNQHPKQSGRVNQQLKHPEIVNQQPKESETVNQQHKQSENVTQQLKQSKTVNRPPKQSETVQQQPKQSDTVASTVVKPLDQVYNVGIEQQSSNEELPRSGQRNKPQQRQEHHNTEQELVKRATAKKAMSTELKDSCSISDNGNMKGAAAPRISNGPCPSTTVQSAKKTIVANAQIHTYHDTDIVIISQSEAVEKKDEVESDKAVANSELVQGQHNGGYVANGENATKSTEKINTIDCSRRNFLDRILGDTQTEKASFSGKKPDIPVVDEDFADSFLIDTQVVLEIDSGPSEKSHNTQNAIDSAGNDSSQVTDKDVHIQRNNRSQISEIAVSKRQPNSNKKEHINENNAENQTGQFLPLTINEKQENIANKSDELLFSDESNIDLDNSGPGNTSVVEQKSEVSLESGCNELDMNIANNSGVDMFDKSEELIAASNYEHFGMSGESRTQAVLADDSYQDLHIPYQSGQERCFQETDKDRPRADQVRSVVINNIGNSKEGVLGQFSSQKPKKITDYSKLQEDLAVAMDMGESFANTFSEQSSGSENVKVVNNCDKARAVSGSRDPDDNIGDSLTFSMMEQALDESKSGDSNLPITETEHMRNEIKSKQHCDIVDLLSDNEMNCNQIVNKTNDDSNQIKPNQNTCTKDEKLNDAKHDQNVIKGKEKSDDRNKNRMHASVFHNDQISTSVLNCFNDETLTAVTPVKAPNKRLRETPVARKQKIQKTHNKAAESDVAGSGTLPATSDSAALSDKRKRSSIKGQSSPGQLNTSTGSDYVPPTPPGDESMIGCTQEHRTPKRTPHCSLKSSVGFSPRLKAAASARKGLQNLSGHKKSTVSTRTSQTTGSSKANRSKARVKLSDGERNYKVSDHETVKSSHTQNSKANRSKARVKLLDLQRNDKVSDNEVAGTSHKQSSKANTSKTRVKVSDRHINDKVSVHEAAGTSHTHSSKAKTSAGQRNDTVSIHRANPLGDVTKEPGNGDAMKEIPEDNVVDTGEDNVEQVDGADDEDKLSPSFIDPDESGLPLTQASFTIVDVCADKRLFKTFILEWRTKTRYAVTLAVERKQQQATTVGIGANFRKDYSPSKAAANLGGIPLDREGHVIVGVAVSWDNRDAYYVSFTHDDPQGDPDDSLAPPPSDPDISISIRLKAVKSVLQQAVCKGDHVTMVMFDLKAHYRAFAEGFGFAVKGQFEDPKVACWMLDPGAREKNLHRMVTNLLPTEVHMLHGIGGGIGYSSLGMSPQNPGSGRYRATTECVLVRHLGEYFRRCLEKEELYSVFTEVEMPSAVTLCRMELNGFGFSQDESENQKGIMIAKLSALEEQAYTLAGHPFSLSATEDVGQVLFVELLLPPNGDPTAGPLTRSLAPATRGGARGKGRQKGQLSTSKDVLEKLKKLHPLPGVILEWRRITNALTKTVFPLQKEKVLCDRLSMYRIYSDCQLHTATGRVSLTEPNLQNVPKDFEITMPDLIGESPPPSSVGPSSRRSRGGQSKLKQMIGPRQVAMVTDESNAEKFSVSMRHAFIPFPGGVLLAADYSQLELRMIAHLSCDSKLIQVLNADGDVFKLITAQWKNIKPEDVTPEERAQAKQVCYGMIYGIGAKALGEQLEVDANDAAVFIETFKAKYPGMRTYLRKTVESCREKGYVQTMLGRKRYLPQITAPNPHARAKAERQAVNTTVQGSAADLVKMATNKIDQMLAQRFPMTVYNHRQKINSRVASTLTTPPEGAWLVLQLHDELIYEVSEAQIMEVAAIVKDAMETAVKLPVRMPVKVKVGRSWGRMDDLTL